jgi:hypothetical protein
MEIESSKHAQNKIYPSSLCHHCISFLVVWTDLTIRDATPWLAKKASLEREEFTSTNNTMLS